MAAEVLRAIAPSCESNLPAWRDPHSSLSEIVGAAREELDAGNYENAWSGFQIALEYWLRVKWIEISGKVNTSVTDRYDLLQKLHSGQSIDPWAEKAIRLVLQRPLPAERWQVEVAAAVVTALAVVEVDSTPKLPREIRHRRLPK